MEPIEYSVLFLEIKNEKKQIYFTKFKQRRPVINHLTIINLGFVKLKWSISIYFNLNFVNILQH